MTDPTPAPPAPQPSDRFGLDAFEASLWSDAKSPAYTGPVLADEDAARAGSWLGIRVFHAPSREYGEIVGRDAAGRFWVRCALHPRDTPAPRLFDGGVLTVVTPEFEAWEHAERRRMAALLAPYGEAREYVPGMEPIVCTGCKTLKPAGEYRQDSRYRDGRRHLCRECERIQSAAYRARRRQARFAEAG